MTLKSFYVKNAAKELDYGILKKTEHYKMGTRVREREYQKSKGARLHETDS